MGLIQSLGSQTLFAMQSIGKLAAPTFSNQDIFSAVEGGNVDVLSNALDESQFDLQTVDEATGKTILHLAVSLGHYDITKMLLDRAGNALDLLDAKDWQGYTPLMHAVARQDIALMNVLAEAHAGMGWLAQNADIDDLGRAQALTLIEAYSDICKAFEISAQYRENSVLKLCFEAGADTSFAMKNAIAAMQKMIEHGYIQANDVLASLENAVKTGDKAAIKNLTMPDIVRLTLAAMRTRPDTEKIAALTSFITAGADTEPWISRLVIECLLNADISRNPVEEGQDDAPIMRDNLGDARFMITVGAPSITALTRLGKRDDGMNMAQQLIGLGADAIGAMRVLRATNQRAANVIAEAALKNVLETSCAPETDKIPALKALIVAGAHNAASDLICKTVSAGESLDTVRLLIRAGASATAALLDLSRSRGNTKTAQRRAYQLIHIGADFFLLMDRLIRVIDSAKESGKQPLARSKQDALNIISYAALKNVLQKKDLSNMQKIEQLQNLISKKGEEAATELIMDAVRARHFSTVKFMIAANAPATEAFIKLGREVDVATAQKLISLGAEFLPLRDQLLKNAEAHTAKGEHGAARREHDVANLWMVAAVAAALQPTLPKSNDRGKAE